VSEDICFSVLLTVSQGGIVRNWRTWLAIAASLALFGCSKSQSAPPPPTRVSASASPSRTAPADLVIEGVSVKAVIAHAKSELKLKKLVVDLVPKGVQDEQCAKGLVVDGSEAPPDGFYVCDDKRLAIAGVVADKLAGQPPVVVWYVLGNQAAQLQPEVSSNNARACAGAYIAASGPMYSGATRQILVAFAAAQEGGIPGRYVEAGVSGAEAGKGLLRTCVGL
jgi:hypothetical protein